MQSYGCLENIGNIIKSHNIAITRVPDDNERECNCPRNERERCPLDGQCYQKNIVYNARVFTNDANPPKDYIGISKPPFKHRYGVHKKSFLDRGYHPTFLSEHIWDLKDKGITFDIKWTILRKTSGYNSTKVQ